MSYNKVILIGHVGRDSEIRYLAHDFSVATFTLATGHKAFVGKDGRQVQEQTDWHRIVASNHLAEWAEKWVRKGMQLGVEGRIRYRQYTDKNGAAVPVTEIVAERLFFVDKAPEQPTEQPAPQPPATPTKDYGQPAYSGQDDSEPF